MAERDASEVTHLSRRFWLGLAWPVLAGVFGTLSVTVRSYPASLLLRFLDFLSLVTWAWHYWTLASRLKDVREEHGVQFWFDRWYWVVLALPLWPIGIPALGVSGGVHVAIKSVVLALVALYFTSLFFA